MTRCKLFAVFTALVFGLAGNAAAELSLQIGAESLRWREHDATGQRLLEERGPRLRVGGNWRTSFDEQRYLFQLHGALYLGQVEYDGQACILGGACSPYISDTNYFGSVVEATLARRFGADAGSELFAGGSIDHWRRDIEGDASVQGAIEDWTVFSVNAGAGTYWRDAVSRFHLRAGVKYPFYTYETPNLYDLTLAPKGRLSFFANAAADFLRNGRPIWGLGLYYDSYRFAVSDRERIGSIQVWQPESRQDLIGLFVTVYLR